MQLHWSTETGEQSDATETLQGLLLLHTQQALWVENRSSFFFVLFLSRNRWTVFVCSSSNPRFRVRVFPVWL